MDPVTHGLLGATIGQAFFKKKLGNKALLWAAPVAMLPDLDMISGYFGSPLTTLYYHRGITHSLFFAPVVGALLGYGAWKFYQKSTPLFKDRTKTESTLGAWITLFSLCLLSHALLDFCTSYGTQLLAPFSNKRFALDAVSVIDPFYTGILFLSLTVGLFLKPFKKFSSYFGQAALGCSTAFLILCYFLNNQAILKGRNDLTLKNLKGYEVESYPTLFQPFYRRLIAQKETISCVSYVSLLHQKHSLTWQCSKESSNPFIKLLKNSKEGQLFTWFAMGKIQAIVTPLDHGETLVQLHDLRYGLPQAPTLWGIETLFNYQGKRVSPIQYFSKPPALNLKFVWDFLERIF